jgi:hypothetical protein
MRFVSDLFNRRQVRRKSVSPRLAVETLESRDLLSNYTLGPLVQVSSTSLLAGSPFDERAAFTNYETEPQLAVDPRNPKHLVGVWHQDATLDGFLLGVATGASFDGGKTWQLTILPGTEVATGGFLPDGGDPWVSFAPNGDVYASVLAYDEQGNGFDTTVRSQILVSKSTDGGLSWGAPTVVIDDVPQPPNIAITEDKDSITADPNDSRFVYDAWDRIQVPPGLIGGKGVLTFARTTDGGQTWEPARAIYDPGTNHVAQAPQILVMPDKSLRLFFSELTLTVTPQGDIKTKDDLKAMRSTDHGQTWSAPVEIAAMKGVEVFDPDNGAFIQTNSSPGEGIVVPIFDVAVDAHNGNLYTVWEDARFNGGQFNRIAFSESTDGGRTWSDPVPINQTPRTIPVGDRSAFIPSIAVAADGTVAVSYYDFRFNDARPGLPTDYWAILGTPAGGKGLADPRAWGDEFRLTDHSSDMELTDTINGQIVGNGLFVGDYEGLSVVGNDFLALFAQAVSADDPDSIFFRRIIADDPLEAASIGHKAAVAAPTSQLVDPLLPEAVRRCQVAGVDNSGMGSIQIQIADLGGTTLGLAAGHTIWLDANAAQWGWYIDPTPHDEIGFPTRVNQGAQSRMDLLTAPDHELGHLLGRDRGDGGVRAGTRPMVSGNSNAGTSRSATEALFALLATDDEAPSIGGSPAAWRHAKRVV